MSRGRRPPRRGMILVVVLLMIALLALTMAGFLFFTRAEGEGIRAVADGHQARLAAESGFEEVTYLLRTQRDNAAVWFDDPNRFRHVLVWARDYKRDGDPVRQGTPRRDMLKAGHVSPAWRYSVVAPRYDGPPDTMRFGLTPESSKLNLNTATDEQLTALLTPLLVGLQVDNPQEIVNAILDWRDEDNEPREGGAENDYYNTLEPAYNAKNGRFDTVEELLLVKGVTAAVLYGEDVNRNGILDSNEDDGDASFPPYDDGDGELDYGIAPFLTVFSREVDTSLDNRARINLWAGPQVVQAAIAADLAAAEEAADAEQPPLSAASATFIATIAGNQSVLQKMHSAADLYAGAGAENEGIDQATGGGADPNDPNNAAGDQLPAELAASPITAAEMAYIMDRISVRPPTEANKPIEGLININAAPLRVLKVIPGMTEEAAAAIVAGRAEAGADLLRTPAWPLIAGAVDAATFRRIAPYITTKAYQFHIEVVGYADHLQTFRRLEWIIEMIGPMAQIKYHRDLTRLGLAWPIDSENVLVTSQ